MFKQWLQNYKEKKEREKERREILDKEYPREYCFYGEYDKQVNEDGLEYSYSHQEVFFANDKSRPTSFQKLSGDITEEVGCEIVDLEERNGEKTYKISVGDEQYSVWISEYNNLDEWITEKSIIKLDDLKHNLYKS